MTRFAIFVALATTLMPSVAFAQAVPASGRYVVEVSAATANVRNDPTGAILGQVLARQRFVVSVERTGWLRIDWQGRRAWLHGGNARRVQAAACEVQPATTVVRAGPSATDPSLGAAARGQAYVSLETRPGWRRVQYDQRSGWLPLAEVRGISFAAPVGGGGAAAPSTGYPLSAQSLLAERVGFGARTTGGDPSRLYRVTTLADSGAGSLRAALESTEPYWVVFDVQGEIKLTNQIRVKSNKTVDGRRRRITISGEKLGLKDVSNIIISDVKLTNPVRGDAIEIRGSNGSARDLWFHHLELTASQDGLIDFRGGTDVTISWCHFHTHLKAVLVSTDTLNNPNQDMRLTAHHNYFERITRRGIELGYGRGDYFNNFQYRWYEHGASSTREAQLLSEANIYEARPGFISFERDPNPGGDRDWLVSKKALITDLDGRVLGYSRSVNDVTVNDAKITTRESGRVFDRASFYQARVDRPDRAMRDRIMNESGPR